MGKLFAKPNDIRWPGQEGLPRLVEDINANFDALFRALAAAGISPAGISPPGPSGGGGTGPTSGLSDPVTESHGGTGKKTYSKGDLLVGKADHKLDRRSIGATGHVLTVAAGDAAWQSPAHEVLSATHSDSEVGTVIRGDVITGQGATPKWKRLAKGTLNYVMKMGASEPAWTDPVHAVLSADHSDATAAAVVRGDLITGQGATPKWTRLPKGTINQVLKGGTNEPTWGEELDPQFALTKRYGFVDNAETTIACAAVGDGTYRFTLGSVGATWRYFRNGVLCTITGSKTVLLAGTNPPTEGTHYIYIDSEVGTLVDGVAWTLLDTKVPVVGIIFHGADTPKFWMADERHTSLIDRKMHYYEHTSEGTKHIYGGTPDGYTVAPVGPVDTENTFSLDACLLLDEDLTINVSPLADGNGTTANYYIFYRSAVSTWLWEKLAMPYRWTNAGYIQYDLAGTMTQGQANKYYNTYLIQTNLAGEAGFLMIHGRAEFGSLALAQAENSSDFSYAGLGIAEFVVAWQFTWATSAAYTTKGKCRLAATPKHLDVSVVTTAVASISADHNHLAGLQGGAPDEYYHLTLAEAGLVAGLPSASVALQAATPGTAQTGHVNITGTILAGPATFTGAFHVDNGDVGIILQTGDSPGDGANGYGVYVQTVLNPDATGAHGLFAGTYFAAPGFGVGSATVTDAATVYIEGPPAGGTNPYALLVGAGLSKFGGSIKTPAESWVGPSDVTGIYFKGGNVGIGTTTPTAQLAIRGSAGTVAPVFSGGTVAALDSVFGAGNGGAYLIGIDYGGIHKSFAGVKGLLADSANNSAGDLAFYTRNASADATLTERMRISQGGNVGIGTTAPSGILDIEASAPAVYINAATAGKGSLSFQNGGVTKGFIGVAGTWEGSSLADFGISAETGLGIRFYTNGSGTAVATIASTGNVGIGTTAPSSKLAVNGGVHVGGDSDAGDNNLLVDGTGTITGAFGCNSKTAQTAYASAGALAAYGTGAFGLDSGANMSALHALVVAIRAALVANGIMS